MIELIVADSVQPYRSTGGHHEIERRARRTRLVERRRQDAGGKRLLAHESQPHKSAGRIGFEFQQVEYLFGTQSNWKYLFGTQSNCHVIKVTEKQS
jgi:hypothetical protein